MGERIKHLTTAAFNGLEGRGPNNTTISAHHQTLISDLYNAHA